jgi:exodeoxyribonuclease-3
LHESLPVKIATWNVNGIRARHAQVLEWIHAERPDVVCLQEIKATCSQVPAALCEMEDYWCYWHGGARGYSGVGLHLRKARWPARPHFLHPDFDFENRMVVAQTETMTIASIYVPNGGKDFPAKMRFFHALDDYAGAFQNADTPLVLCGDLNIAREEIDVHPKERDPRCTGQTPEERALFAQILGRGLVDLGRVADPENVHLFTWWAPWRNMRARNIGWRLDYILASQSLAATAQSCVVQTQIGTSDHAPVMATFNI